jgi:hypothetical protein
MERTSSGLHGADNETALDLNWGPMNSLDSQAGYHGNLSMPGWRPRPAAKTAVVFLWLVAGGLFSLPTGLGADRPTRDFAVVKDLPSTSGDSVTDYEKDRCKLDLYLPKESTAFSVPGVEVSGRRAPLCNRQRRQGHSTVGR